MSKGTAGLSTIGSSAVAAPPVESSRREMPEAERAALDCLARGDRRGAVDALLLAYSDEVYSHCRRVLRDSTLAEDVFQQVFLEAIRDLGGFEGRSSLRAWLIGVAYHRSLDALKARRRQRERLDDGEDAVERAADVAADPEALADRARRARELGRCLGALSAEARMTVLMRYRLGLSYEEMAETVGERPGTLHARVTRALPALRRCLEAKGITP
jgi:RNA polymerase sigma-70 factor, ECF subfamily